MRKQAANLNQAEVNRAASVLRRASTLRPQLAIVLGSGFGPALERAMLVSAELVAQRVHEVIGGFAASLKGQPFVTI